MIQFKTHKVYKAEVVGHVFKYKVLYRTDKSVNIYNTEIKTAPFLRRKIMICDDCEKIKIYETNKKGLFLVASDIIDEEVKNNDKK